MEMHKDHHHLIRKVLEMDLEEIRLLAMAAQTAPAHVRQQLLGIIMGEVQGACFWNTQLACCRRREGMMSPCSGSGDIYQPFQKDYGKEKEEG